VKKNNNRIIQHGMEETSCIIDEESDEEEGYRNFYRLGRS
jgi:hypothetical protein